MTATLVIPVVSALSATVGLRDAVTRFCETHGIPAAACLPVKTAIEETVVNVITHGYHEESGRIVEVRLELGDGILIATIADDAEPFDPLQARTPDVTAPLVARPVGGLGVALVRRLMDDVVYRREGHRNILVLTKRVA